MKKKTNYWVFAIVFSFSLFSAASAIYAKKYPDTPYAKFYSKSLGEMGLQVKHYLQKVLSGGALYHGNIIPERAESYRAMTSEDEYLTALAMEIAMENYATHSTMPKLTEKKPSDTPLRDSDGFVYYNQTDSRWAESPYGSDGNTIRVYGCGPTALASVVSSLTDTIVTPPEMAVWAYDHGYYSRNHGSFHSLIPDGAAAYGLDVVTIAWNDADRIAAELSQGRLIVALMAKGHFTAQGHFIILRKLDDAGNLYIADPKSSENTNALWTIDTIIDEAKRGASAGGPFWSIGKKAEEAP